MINISELTEASSSVLQSINELLPQLSSSAQVISMDRLSELVESDNTIIFLGTDDNGSDFRHVKSYCYENSDRE
jgi:hypothetical protein